MMPPDFEQKLGQYAELVVKVGLNLQSGQRLVIGSASNRGVSIQAAPLVRLIAASAYRAGARFVDVMWNDEQLHLVRFRHAPRDSFEEFPHWQAQALLEYARRGDALLTVLANDPDLLSSEDPELIATVQKINAQKFHPVLELVTRNAMNWCVVGAAAPGWAAKVFPDVDPLEQEAKLWRTIFEICRLNKADPLSEWREHVNALAERSRRLSAKQYRALKFTAPGTALNVGLPPGHIWESGRSISAAGIDFTANIPTEEVFTLPHKDETEGFVSVSKPLSWGGTLIEDIRLIFAGGRVVDVAAGKGETVLRRLIDTDDGSGRLGEVALVPHSSPIAQSNLVFYNLLFDENAACHIALGRGYKFTLAGGEKLSDEEFEHAGGNRSMIHLDLMIGSGEMDVDGLSSDGTREPVMRRGEWALTV